MTTVTPAATPTCWQAFTEGATVTSAWLGRQASELGKGLKAGLVKTVAYAQIFFAKIAEYSSSAFTSIRNAAGPYLSSAKVFLLAHQKEAAIAVGAFAVGAAVVHLWDKCCTRAPGADVRVEVQV